MLSSFNLVRAVLFVIILVRLFLECDGVEKEMAESECVDPEVMVIYALSASANRTLPTDLVMAVTEWIPLPSQMPMNELILCKTNSASSQLWGKKCDRLIRQQISRCNADHNSFITLSPSDDVLVLELQDPVHFGLFGVTGCTCMYHTRPFKKYLDVLFNVYGHDSSGEESVISRSVNVTLGLNYCIPVLVTRKLVALYKGFYLEQRDFIVRRITVQWRRHGCSVKNMLQLLPST